MDHWENEEKESRDFQFKLLRTEGEDSQVWLDNSLPIVKIWMELFADGVVKSKVFLTKPPKKETAVFLTMENNFF